MSNVQPLVSIIIPVYKVEKYLKDCVDSVRNQTYTNLEIILVDDGSPDRCGQMCDQYAAEDSRIRVIHQRNSGVAEARNTGIRNVRGEYLFFVDSDDVVADQAIELMVNTAKVFNADMVCSECIRFDENGGNFEDSEVNGQPMRMTRDEAMRYYAPLDWAPWNRLVKTSIHNNIFFPAFKIHEDEAIKFLLLERCKCIIHLFSQTYFYRQRANSITGIESRVDKMDMFYSRRESLNYLKTNHPSIVVYFLPNVCNAALYNLGVLIQQKNSEMRTKRIQEIVSFVLDNYRGIIQNPFLTITQKIRFLFIKYSNWTKNNCLYIRFYTTLQKIRRR